MVKAYVLSEADRDLLKQIVQDYFTQMMPSPSDPKDVDDYRTSGVHIAYPDDAAGIPAMDTTGTADPTPGSGLCTIYQLSAAALPTVVKFGFKDTVYNLQSSVIPQSYFLVHRLKTGGWVAGAGGGSSNLVECCLSENHPGLGIPFSIEVGTWDPATDSWQYSGGTGSGTGTGTGGSAMGIDWRYGVPYPAAYARGLFIPRASDTYGTIYEAVSMDCTSPGTCNPTGT